jgi:hypothetical protein
MTDVTEHLLDLKGELSRNSAILEGVAAKLDGHIIKTAELEQKVTKLEQPMSAMTIGRASAAFVGFTAAVVGIVVSVMKLLGISNSF